MLAAAASAATVSCMSPRRRLLLPLGVSLAVPAALTAATVAGSVRTFRRFSGLPAGLPELPGERRTVEFEGETISFRFFAGTDPDREPVLFLHGWGSSGDASFFPVLPGVRSPFLVPDLPGHGSSSCRAGFSLEFAARSVLAVMDETGVRSPHVVAHSMGGPVAFSALRLRPGCFSRLTAVATALHWQSPRMSPSLLGATLFTAPVSPVTLRKLANRVRAVPSYSEALVWAWKNRPDVGTLKEAARALHRFDARRWDVQLPPTRWVVPSDDHMVMPSRQRRAARLVGAEILEVEDGGHSFFLVEPEALLEAIRLPSPRRGDAS
jgi:pimeloyl-ACP methyl ester carboxylesterase